MSAETYDSLTVKSKPKKKSIIERELETSLTEKVTSPVLIDDKSSTSRYGRARRSKTENDFVETNNALINISKSQKPCDESLNELTYDSPVKIETPRKSHKQSLDTQIEHIYNENKMMSRFSSEKKVKPASIKSPKIYVRKDLIQHKEKEETLTLIKNMFSPGNHSYKPSNRRHSNKYSSRSSEKYTLNKSLNSHVDMSSVVKTLDFDSKRKREKDTKVDISKSDLFDLEAKCSFQVGDLAWARIGTFPFWPCIVTRDPENGMFVKKKLFGRIERDIINVTFCKDNGRRSWVIENMLRPFKGRTEFMESRDKFTPESKKRDPRFYAAFFVSDKKQHLWNLSIDEAETLLKEPKRFRIERLNEMILKARAEKFDLKKSGKITRTDSDVSLSESLYDSLFSEEDVNDDSRDKSRIGSKNKSFDVSDVVTACLDNMAAKTGITKIKKQSHMDRWLQKAKSKTPEKNQFKVQISSHKTSETKTGSTKKRHQQSRSRSSRISNRKSGQDLTTKVIDIEDLSETIKNEVDPSSIVKENFEKSPLVNGKDYIMECKIENDESETHLVKSTKVESLIDMTLDDSTQNQSNIDVSMLSDKVYESVSVSTEIINDQVVDNKKDLENTGEHQIINNKSSDNISDKNDVNLDVNGVIDSNIYEIGIDTKPQIADSISDAPQSSNETKTLEKAQAEVMKITDQDQQNEIAESVANSVDDSSAEAASDTVNDNTEITCITSCESIEMETVEKQVTEQTDIENPNKEKLLKLSDVKHHGSDEKSLTILNDTNAVDSDQIIKNIGIEDTTTETVTTDQENQQSVVKLTTIQSFENNQQNTSCEMVCEDAEMKDSTKITNNEVIEQEDSVAIDKTMNDLVNEIDYKKKSKDLKEKTFSVNGHIESVSDNSKNDINLQRCLGENTILYKDSELSPHANMKRKRFSLRRRKDDMNDSKGKSTDSKTCTPETTCKNLFITIEKNKEIDLYIQKSYSSNNIDIINGVDQSHETIRNKKENKPEKLNSSNLSPNAGQDINNSSDLKLNVERLYLLSPEIDSKVNKTITKDSTISSKNESRNITNSDKFNNRELRSKKSEIYMNGDIHKEAMSDVGSFKNKLNSVIMTSEEIKNDDLDVFENKPNLSKMTPNKANDLTSCQNRPRSHEKKSKRHKIKYYITKEKDATSRKDRNYGSSLNDLNSSDNTPSSPKNKLEINQINDSENMEEAESATAESVQHNFRDLEVCISEGDSPRRTSPSEETKTSDIYSKDNSSDRFYDSKSINSENNELPLSKLSRKIGTVSFNSNAGSSSRRPKGNKNKPTMEPENVSDALKDKEFVKYMELRQDQILDENPQLTQSDLIKYLYKTWLYKEVSRSNRQKTDELESSTVVKGLQKDEPIVKPKRRVNKLYNNVRLESMSVSSDENETISKRSLRSRTNSPMESALRSHTSSPCDFPCKEKVAKVVLAKFTEDIIPEINKIHNAADADKIIPVDIQLTNKYKDPEVTSIASENSDVPIIQHKIHLENLATKLKASDKNVKKEVAQVETEPKDVDNLDASSLKSGDRTPANDIQEIPNMNDLGSCENKPKMSSENMKEVKTAKTESVQHDIDLEVGISEGNNPRITSPSEDTKKSGIYSKENSSDRYYESETIRNSENSELPLSKLSRKGFGNNLNTVSLNLNARSSSRRSKGNKNKLTLVPENVISDALKDTEFVKYMELRQDQILDENPQLTQSDLIKYLYRTWLYEEESKSDRKKTDELESSTLVKGHQKDEPTFKPKRRVNKLHNNVRLESMSVSSDENETISKRSLRSRTNSPMESAMRSHTSAPCDFPSKEKVAKVVLAKFTEDIIPEINKIHNAADADKIIPDDIQLTNKYIDPEVASINSENSDVPLIQHKIHLEKLATTVKASDKNVTEEIALVESEPKTEDNLDASSLKPEVSTPENDMQEISSMDDLDFRENKEKMSSENMKEVESAKAESVQLNIRDLEVCISEGNIPRLTSPSEDTKKSDIYSKENSSDRFYDSESINSENSELPLSKLYLKRLEDDLDTVSLNSNASSSSRRSKRNKNKLTLEPESVVSEALENTEFVKYMELRQDQILDENPQLTQSDLIKYLYKTWLYEEESKSDRQKTDELESSTLVKGLQKDESIVKPKRRANKLYNNVRLESMSVSSDENETISKRSLRSRTNSPMEAAMRSHTSSLCDFPFKEKLAKVVLAKFTEDVIPDINKMHSAADADINIPTDLQLTNKDIDPEVASIDSENSDVPLIQHKIHLEKLATKLKASDKNVKEEVAQVETEPKVEGNLDALSLKSEDSAESLKKVTKRAKEATKALDDPEFVKYLELRQDNLIDDHPELTYDEIVQYLFKTWLYEESSKPETVKIDEMEQQNLVKGLNNEALPQPKKIKKKSKNEKEGIDADEVAGKDKPKRKVAPACYNEEYFDMEDIEDDIKYFEIFKKKPKSTTVHEPMKSESETELVLDSSKIVSPELEKDPICTDVTTTEIVPIEPKLEAVKTFDKAEIYFQNLTKPKPNVFRGMSRDKVCEICRKPSQLVKCKGCHEMFHVECVKKEVEMVDMPNTPKSRKKKKKPRGRKLKSANDSIESSSHSDEKCQTLNTSEDLNVSIEEIEPIVADADSFEAQVAAKMKEIMDAQTNPYTPFKSNFQIGWATSNSGKCEIVDVKLVETIEDVDYSDFKCNNCQKSDIPLCFVCKSPVSPKSGIETRQKCQHTHCHKYYHLECLDHWPQTQFSSGEIARNKKTLETYEPVTCPRHVCHTCVSDDPRGCKTRFSADKLARCVRCPATYHTFTKCLPAGTQILTGSNIICPRHYEHRPGNVTPRHVNTGWCFICALGGILICCEYCPTSFHADCLKISPPEGGYMCEDCETGRLPLYGEMVWVKLGVYRWWPGLILHPSEVPANIMAVKHSPGEFVVRFFGQYDHYWVNRGRVFPFQEGDSGRISSQKSKIDAAFTMAMEHAQRACQILKNANLNQAESEDIASSLLPPAFVKLKVNKPCGSLIGRRVELEESSLTQCECDPNDVDPCGPNSSCLNRMLLTECGPTCRAGDRCLNRAFEKRQYPKLTPYRTPYRGWGLKTLEDIKMGQFVIEYVGELIDEEEFRRRMARMHDVRDENFYFLTLDKERMIDAGPKGNFARFMNHCCEPNCETQKWTVLADVRVGLFALKDIPAGSEVTFNYNFECAGIEKKRCLCGAKRCSGYIGAKPKQEEQQPKKPRIPGVKRVYRKRKPEESPTITKSKVPKPRTTSRSKPKELTEIEKDLLIIKSATNGLSSDSEASGRLSSFDLESDKNQKLLKRKRVSFSTESEVILLNSDAKPPSIKRCKVESDKVNDVGD